MRFIQSIFASAALIAAALAVEINVGPDGSVEAGSSFVIEYSPADLPTTIIVRKGEATNLDPGTTLTTSATGGKFTWNVDSSLVNGDDYALEIRQDGATPNYWGPFAVTGGSEETESSSSASASSTAESSSSSEYPTTITTTTASGSPTPTPGQNSTVSTGAPSSSRTGGSTPTQTDGAPEATGAATLLTSSPLALIFGAVAAMVYLN